MKTRSHRYLLTLTVMAAGLAFCANPAQADDPTAQTTSIVVDEPAAPPVTWQLAPEAKVDGSGIFLSQVVKATPPVVLPQIRLAPAPSPGQTNYFSREQIIALIETNASDLSPAQWTGPARIRVSRKMHLLDEVEATSLLTAALQREYVKEQGELELRFARPWTPVLAPDDMLTVKLTEMPQMGVNANFIAGFELWQGKERVGHWQAVLLAKVWRDVPVAQTPLKRGELLRDADVAMERRDALTLRDVVLSIDKNDDSLALTEQVGVGLPVPNRAVRPRAVVKRGQLVDGVFAQGSLTISLKVEIMEDGALGQIVRVRNPKTKRELSGKVQNEETVKITL